MIIRVKKFWHGPKWEKRVDAVLSSELATFGSIVEGNAKSECPVKTGALRDSIDSTMVASDVVRVGSTLPYASAVEYGTRHSDPQPFLRDGLDKSALAVTEVFT